MISVLNYDNTLSSDKINEIIKLLPNKYQKLNIKIFILKNKWQSLLYIRNLGIDQIKYVFKKVTSGVAMSDNTTFIYPFILEEDDINLKQLRMIHTLYHEIRHHWQHINNPIEYRNRNTAYSCNLVVTDEGYNRQKQEVDANGFAECIMLKKYNEISDLLGYTGWYFIHE